MHPSHNDKVQAACVGRQQVIRLFLGSSASAAAPMSSRSTTLRSSAAPTIHMRREDVAYASGYFIYDCAFESPKFPKYANAIKDEARLRPTFSHLLGIIIRLRFSDLFWLYHYHACCSPAFAYNLALPKRNTPRIHLKVPHITKGHHEGVDGVFYKDIKEIK